MGLLTKSANLYRSARFKTMLEHLRAPRTVAVSRESGSAGTTAVDLSTRANASDRVRTTVYGGGKLPGHYNTDEFRAAIVRGGITTPEFAAALLEQHVPLLLHGSTVEVLTIERKIRELVPGSKTRNIRLYERSAKEPAIGREFLFQEGVVCLMQTPAAAVAAAVPNCVLIEASELCGITGVPHVALLQCFLKTWCAAPLHADSCLLILDRNPAVAGILARQMPEPPPQLCVVTEVDTPTADEAVREAHNRMPPTGQTAATMGRMAAAVASGVATWTVTDWRETRETMEDRERLVRLRDDAAQQRAARSEEKRREKQAKGSHDYRESA